jgi:hypothetical protein
MTRMPARPAAIRARNAVDSSFDQYHKQPTDASHERTQDEHGATKTVGCQDTREAEQAHAGAEQSRVASERQETERGQRLLARSVEVTTGQVASEAGGDREREPVPGGGAKQDPEEFSETSTRAGPGILTD